MNRVLISAIGYFAVYNNEKINERASEEEKNSYWYKIKQKEEKL